ncbi:putative mobilization protein BmgA [Flavobacterium psychrophilum]|uniref:relaxase/mobilization nuclease domain-containing protein n=1 Tax=Flavobacterium psychrophilum TaxID=96345 RepID=UPI000B7C1F57|nr:relaxase/mobilization nuclease domain-containing protein [Flavobacterium psychrophilum]SNB30418.1 putative mobilization protein BmgA [Flavobacterium psychrophilum]
MIGLAKSCSGGGALGNYICDERKGYELDRNNLCGLTPKEIFEEMTMIQDLNQRATNKTFSLVLSPDIKDGKNLSDEQLKAMTQEYLTKLGIDPEKQQYVAFVHTEKEHKHIHIIANRVEPSGKLISDHHIGKRAQWIAHGIAKERGLVSAKEKMFEKIKNNEQNKGELKVLKNEIFKKHQEVIRDKPRTFDNYIKQMNSKGLEVKPTINKQGEIQGFRIIDIETKNDFKASEINRSMSIGNLIKSGLKNDLKNQLNSTLKTTAKKQNLGLEHQLKRTINSKSKSKNFGKEKGKFTLGKEKLTLKQRVEYSKVEDMMVDNINIKHQEYWNDQPKFEELKQQLENKNHNKDNER